MTPSVMARLVELGQLPRRLLLIRGVSGSGKTTFAEAIVRTCHRSSLTVAHLETDMWFMDDEGVYRFSPDKLAWAHSECQMATIINMLYKQDVIVVANTFTQQWELEPYRQLARQYNYAVVEHTMPTHNLTTTELASRNRHGVPVEVIQRQRDRWEA